MARAPEEIVEENKERREASCEWNYTLPEEREHAIAILLPDVQEMRQWGRLIVLKAKLEASEGKSEDSIRTLETGLAFSGHIGEGPFVINALVGVAVASTMIGELDELIGRPETPNLYWALTALPRPLIGVREAFENEMKVLEWMVPELDQVDRPRGEVEWAALLAGFHRRLVAVTNMAISSDPNAAKFSRPDPDLGRFRASILPEARTYLGGQGRSLDGMVDDQVVMLYVAGLQREIRDEWSKAAYLSAPESVSARADLHRRYAGYKTGPLGIFVTMIPNVESCRLAQITLERKVAMLRAIEAIRMQAAIDGGKLPESLEKVTVVPVPVDPATGQAFLYRAEGEAMILSSPLFFERGLSYRLTLRK